MRVDLRDNGVRMPVNHSWISATAMAAGVPVVTQGSDYVDVRGLDVIHV
jgi:predicted nucleic acid-binding protein